MNVNAPTAVTRHPVSTVAAVAVSTLLGLGVVLVAVDSAHAACSPDKSNSHTQGSVPHGWSRVFCQPANNYNFSAWTNHGHGQKCVAIWHSGASHLHCDQLASGSQNASCQAYGINVHHYSWYDVAGVSCVDRYADGHGFDCHQMEALP